jgi:hypothetical protein
LDAHARESGSPLRSIAVAPMAYRAKNPSVYILASRRNGTLYIGVTSDLAQRVTLHKQI